MVRTCVRKPRNGVLLFIHVCPFAIPRCQFAISDSPQVISMNSFNHRPTRWLEMFYLGLSHPVQTAEFKHEIVNLLLLLHLSGIWTLHHETYRRHSIGPCRFTASAFLAPGLSALAARFLAELSDQDFARTNQVIRFGDTTIA